MRLPSRRGRRPGPSPAPSSTRPCATAADAAARGAACRLRERQAAREQSGQRRRVRAAGAVRRARRRAARPGSRRARAPSKRWSTGVVAVAAGDERGRARRARASALGQLAPRRAGHAGERLRLGQVRRHDRREREEPADQRLDRVVLRAAARPSSRPSPDRRRAGRGARSRNSATVSMIAREKSIPVFAASTPMSSKTASSCARTKSGGTSCTAVTADRVLRGQRDDRAHPVAARGGERLQVGLDAGAAARVGRRRSSVHVEPHATPFAGTSRIRFDGCDLSPARGTPVGREG